jgi:hypothetical protein
MPSGWRMGGEANSQKNADDDVEGHSFSAQRNAEDDVEGHAMRNVEDDQVETGTEKPGDRARVRARVKNDDSDTEGHALLKNDDEDVEGHTWASRNADDDVEGHTTAR